MWIARFIHVCARHNVCDFEALRNLRLTNGREWRWMFLLGAFALLRVHIQPMLHELAVVFVKLELDFVSLNDSLRALA